MDTLRSWIDEGELRDLANFMLADPDASPFPSPPAETPPAPETSDTPLAGDVAEALNVDESASFAGGKVLDARQRAGAKLAEIFTRASESGVIDQAESAPEVEPAGSEPPLVASNSQPLITSPLEDVPSDRSDDEVAANNENFAEQIPPESPMEEVKEAFASLTFDQTPEDKISEALAVIEGRVAVPKPRSDRSVHFAGTQESSAAGVGSNLRSELTEFRVPQAPLPVRLSAFGEWLDARHGFGRFFVADERGFVVHVRGVDASVVEESSALAKAGRRLGERVELPVVHLEMAGGDVLSLIPASAAPCPLTLGIVSSVSVARELSSDLGLSLRMAVDGGAQG